MSIQELRDKSVKELQEELLELRRELLNLRLQKSMGESPRPHLFRSVRRDVARVKTLIHEKNGKVSENE